MITLLFCTSSVKRLSSFMLLSTSSVTNICIPAGPLMYTLNFVESHKFDALPEYFDCKPANKWFSISNDDLVQFEYFNSKRIGDNWSITMHLIQLTPSGEQIVFYIWRGICQTVDETRQFDDLLNEFFCCVCMQVDCMIRAPVEADIDGEARSDGPKKVTK